MEILIDTLEGKTITVELAGVGVCYPDDDVIYFSGVPCLLSSARAKKENLPAGIGEALNSGDGVYKP